MLSASLLSFLALLSLGAAAPIDGHITYEACPAVYSSPPIPPIPGAGCPDVQIITARASTEAPGEGSIAPVASLIQKDSKQTITRASVNYPATLEDYPESSAKGVVALKAQLKAAVEKCPKSKIVLLGYSQGAHVIGDVLGGGAGGALGPETPAIEHEYSSHVTAVIMFGDPRHVDNEKFQYGSDKTGGQGAFPRPADISLAPFSNVIASWCNNNDYFCASGQSLIVHGSYIGLYTQAAADFVLKKIGH